MRKREADKGGHLAREITIVDVAAKAGAIPQVSSVHPALTTIRQPLEEMSRSAAHLLLKYLAHPNAKIERIELPTRLVIRESCQAFST